MIRTIKTSNIKVASASLFWTTLQVNQRTRSVVYEIYLRNNSYQRRYDTIIGPIQRNNDCHYLILTHQLVWKVGVAEVDEAERREGVRQLTGH